MTGHRDAKKAFITLALPIAIALAASNLGCSPEVPAMPTYTNDVRPILMAHCVRCHGANDTLNPNPDLMGQTRTMPMTCYLQRYEDAGDCTTAATCQRGAGYCGTVMSGTDSLISARINYAAGEAGAMPPPPADRLNDWEKEVLTRWSTATPAP